jgi:hypothetical protein
MMRKLVSLACVCVAPCLGSAQSIRVGPVLQDASPDEMWVMWEATDGSPGSVEFGPGPGFGLVVSSTQIPSVAGATIHHARLPNLLADTTYHYRVRSGTAFSSTSTFRTPPVQAAEAPFRFAAYSDVQGGPVPDKHTEIVNDGVIDFVTETFGPVVPDELAFVIVPGDLVSTGTVYGQWKEQFFDEAANLTRQVPYYPVPGNHEQDTKWFFDYFKLPDNGTTGFEEHWWYKDHGNLRLIGLDSNTSYRIQEQLDWLDDVLDTAAQDDRIDFVFAQLHHPHLSELWTPGNTDYTRVIAEKLGVFSTASGKPSAHFFGHTHGYERGSSRDHEHLYINVAAGEGGVDYWGIVPPADYDEIQKSFPDWGFVIVEVTAGDDPTVRIRRVSRGNQVEPKDNVVMDDVTIRRYNAPPATPTPQQPSPGTSGTDPLGTFVSASAFSDADAQDFHAESHFQLTTTPGDWSNAEDVWIRYENWAAPPGASGQGNGWYSVNTVDDPDVSRITLPRLEPSTEYNWRVRYRDSSLRWSAWSQASSFSTGELPTGACCLPVGGCEQLIDLDCTAAGGTFAGVGTDCDDAGCPDLITVFEETFDGVTLGASVDEVVPGAAVWSGNPPSGWFIDNAGVPAGGVTEWRGWAFADPTWWAQAAGDQGRSGFASASGVIAVADPDEWDDAPRDPGTYTTLLTTPAIDITAVDPGSARLVFRSSWMPEGNQRAEIRVSVDGGAPTAVAVWESNAGVDFKQGNVDELVVLDLQLPPGAQSIAVSFGLLNAGNNWWWAIDDVRVVGDARRAISLLFYEDFESVPLGPNVDEPLSGTSVWSGQPPTGWSFDDTGVPSIGVAGRGVTEWEGWAIADRAWWTQVAEDQRRSEFTLGERVVAVADPDEWNDIGNPQSLGPYGASMITPAIDVTRAAGSEVTLAFASSWRPEDLQRAWVHVGFDGSAEVALLEWASTGPQFKGAATNEPVSITTDVPDDAVFARFRFEMSDAANDWWWAIDRVSVTGEFPGCNGADVSTPFGDLTFSDITRFVDAFVSGYAVADLTYDGELTFADVSQFLSEFADGCG